MTDLKICPTCSRRSRFSLCTVCFTRLTLTPDRYESLPPAQLQALYIGAREREEYFDLLRRDLWHLLKGAPAADDADDFNATYSPGKSIN